MKSLRKPLLLLIAGAALIAAGLIESFNYLAAKHRDQVTQELRKVLGDDVSFTSLEVNLWGRPGFVATELRIADDDRFAATPAVRARELVLGVSVANLLLGRLVVTALAFDQPEFQIIMDETGRLNLSALIDRKTELRNFPRLRSSADRKPTPISFSVDEVAISNGRIDYIDRSVRQPAELQVRNVSMRVSGFQPGETMRMQIGASLTPGLRQDVRISGEIARSPEAATWAQRGIAVNVAIDSLHVPIVARAIAALRDRIPSELDVTGPMALQMIARGTLERPRLEDITLKVPLFGSTDYNAVITGRVKFGERRSWEQAELDGKVAIDPLSLNRLRSFAVFENLLPAALISEGSVKITSRFEGRWEELRVGALVLADKADVRYKQWLHKPAETPVTIRTRMTRRKQEFLVHPSELDIAGQKITFAGGFEYQAAPLLRLHVLASNAPAASWGRFFRMPGLQATAGTIDLDVTGSTDPSAADGRWMLRGAARLNGTALKHAASGRTVDDVHAQIFFEGTKARVQTGRVRLGSSTLFLDGGVAELDRARFQTPFRADRLQLADLTGLGIVPDVQLKNASGDAELVLDHENWLLTGSVAAPESSFNKWPLRDLRANIEWDPAGLTLRNIQAQAFQGAVRAEGYLPGVGGQTRPFVVSGQVEGLDVRAFIVQWFPLLRDRLEGRFFGHARFEAAGADTAGVKDALTGAGQADLRSGMIRSFNLASQLLLKGSDSTLPASSLSRMPPGLTALFQRRDTSFDSVKADFRMEQNRLFSDNLVITTPDYTITGAGWLGFDRSTRWNGMLVLSSRLTQEVQREYRGLRYLLDRRGRLAIGFRVDGPIPNISVRLENRAFAQAFGFDTDRKGADGKGGDAGKTQKNWIPDALERYLNR